MRAWTSIGSLTLAVLTLAGCFAPFGTSVPSGRPVRDVYDEPASGTGPRLQISPVKLPGRPEMTRPVIYPPKVLAVWVPEHLDLDRDFKIGAHWVYMKLRDSSWVEESIDREPAGDRGVLPADLARARDALGGERLARILISYGVPAQTLAPADPPLTEGRR